MRINVYSQEIDLIRVPEMVVKSGLNKEGKVEDFIGLRFFLISPDVIHQTPTDDDQSAITFWLPESVANRVNMHEHFRYAAWLIDDVLGKHARRHPR